jgi:hypothetical protein
MSAAQVVLAARTSAEGLLSVAELSAAAVMSVARKSAAGLVTIAEESAADVVSVAAEVTAASLLTDAAESPSPARTGTDSRSIRSIR